MEMESREKIHWLSWGQEAFDRAKNEDKLVLLSVVTPWCHWSHIMDRNTYSDNRVIGLVNQRFIPVRVNSDTRPDIRDRYLMGGWPTTSFLIPDGYILSGSTCIPTDAMLNKLSEMDSFYTDQKELALMHAVSMEAEAEFMEADQGSMEDDNLDQMNNIILGAVSEAFDPVYYGFMREPKFLYPETIHYAFLQFRRHGNSSMLKMALSTLDAMMKLNDPVWGGFYRYSTDRTWSKPSYEKLLIIQAEVMNSYLEGFLITSNQSYAEIAASIASYVNRFLCNHDDGGFYASQDSDIGGNDVKAPLIPGDSYYSLDESARMAIGIPYLDKTIYTDWNARMVSAYFHLYEMTGDNNAKSFALKTLNKLIKENIKGHCVCHTSSTAMGFLSDQVYLGIALVEAYQLTGNRFYLFQAEGIAEYMKHQLHDVVQGGFYLCADCPSAIGHLSERRKPYLENISAVMFLNDLYYLTGNGTYRVLAGEALKGSNRPNIIMTVLGSAYGTAIDAHRYKPLRVIIVGNQNDPDALEMLDVANRSRRLRKLAQILNPEYDSQMLAELGLPHHSMPKAFVIDEEGNIEEAGDKNALQGILGELPDRVV